MSHLSYIFRSNPPQMIPSAGSKYWVVRGLGGLGLRAKSTTVAGFNGKSVFFCSWLMWETSFEPYPIGSMYGIFTYIYHKNQPNVGKYTIHGSLGYFKGYLTSNPGLCREIWSIFYRYCRCCLRSLRGAACSSKTNTWGRYPKFNEWNPENNAFQKESP